MSNHGRDRPGSATPIDFVGLAAALLDRAHILVPQWLPGGVERNGRWYVGDFDGGEGESANVSLVTGTWIDNAAPDEDKGADLISLYARIRGLGNGAAARELMRDLGWDRQVVQASASPRPATPATPEAALAAAVQGDAEQPVAEEGEAPAARSATTGRDRWKPIVPVPAHAPAPKFRWSFKDKARDTWVELTAVRHWEYAFEGTRFGYVARFERENSKGVMVKDTLPFTWCTDTEDPAGSQRWHTKQWPAPRPLYVPATLLAEDKATIPVVLVEGEKCAEAGHQLLGHEFDFVSWPGGCKAWAMADWSWLAGRTVYLWPDADAQRFRLNKAEREADLDPESKPLVPLALQPGYSTMAKIGSVLMTEQRCQVLMVRMKEPGARPGGWDLADAIADGWDAVAVRDYIRGAREFVPADDAVRAAAKKNAAQGQSTPSGAGAGNGGSTGIEWRDKLLCAATGAVKAVRENLVLALDGMPLPDGGILAGIEEARGVIAFNEFTNNVEKTADTPWGTRAGVWEEVDELEMGNWLTREHYLPSMPRGTLEEAVAMVAWRHRYHPVRAEFEALRGTWDQEKRLGTWLARACMEEDELDAGLQGYLARVGTWLLMGICARIIQPGCKFDFMTIFEGPQGVGKSTLAKVLGGEHFADTGLVLGEKDSYQNLQGVLIYEWGELDALSKADVRKVKQFISSQKDRFRASFDRRPKDYPRQVVFIGTTNEDHYLVDQTGNRRFWPVRINRHIDLEWVRANRQQLFAEALAYLDAGERFHPSPREQRELFDPQQQQRQVEDAIQAAVLRYLYDENQRVTGAGENGTLVSEITVQDLLSKVGITIDKQTHVLMRQATAAMRHAGWERFRSSRGDRPWMFRRPAGAAGENPMCTPQAMVQQPAQGTSTTRGADAIPF